MTQERRRFVIGYAVWIGWSSITVAATWFIASVPHEKPLPRMLFYGVLASMTGCALLGGGIALAQFRAQRTAENRIAQGRCPQCSYDLRGNVSGVCPECGTPVAGKAGVKG